ncbi:MAG TPA: hypothetical protein VLV86_14560 [Vicinamibacterales bacterium]|nr:hypothetical protein [Vicinamibacterales bacterium]
MIENLLIAGPKRIVCANLFQRHQRVLAVVVWIQIPRFQSLMKPLDAFNRKVEDEAVEVDQSVNRRHVCGKAGPNLL